MAVVCPAITARDEANYQELIEKVAAFAERLHIDLTDGIFAKAKTPLPEKAWWPVGVKADFHIMYKNPLEAVKKVILHKPNLIIIHAESDGNFPMIAEFCHRHGVKIGVALMPNTPAGTIAPALDMMDHVLIFSGHIGHYGGVTHTELLSKVVKIKEVNPTIEIGWDGGVDTNNAAELVLGGVDVLNAGGFILNNEHPERAYQHLARIAAETGTT